MTHVTEIRNKQLQYHIFINYAIVKGAFILDNKVLRDIFNFLSTTNMRRTGTPLNIMKLSITNCARYCIKVIRGQREL